MSAELPIDALQDRFRRELAEQHLVVTATTGSGKSTRLPLWAAEQGSVLVVEPRRVACTALAGFLAEQPDNTGHRIGHAIRFENTCTPDTRIAFVTPGVALRWLNQGQIDRFRTVMLDEFHERRWDTDLLLALLKHADRHRLVITSATVEGKRLADYLGGSLLEAQGRSHPVSVQYQAPASHHMPTLDGLETRVRRAVAICLAESGGDVLVFLPGKREIQTCEQALQSLPVETVALHAGASMAEQRRALNPGAQRRVILATNVAETSLTIPGVTAVVDSGLERRTHRRNRRTVLGLQPISQASADQRRGRAGRTRPGMAVRLWGAHAPLESRTPPETQREELSELVLAAACAGVTVDQLVFPEPLPPHAVEQAQAQLGAMGAIDGAGHVTEHGRKLFALPIDTLFAHLISAMPDEASRGFMVDLSAALSSGPRPIRLPRSAEGRETLKQWQPRGCDATTLVAAVRSQPPEAAGGNRQARQEARKLAGQIRDLLDLPAIPDTPEVIPDRVLQACIQALPELAFVRRKHHKRRDAMGNGQSEVWIAEDSRLDDDVEAAVVFDSHSMPGKGTRQTLTLATCAAPLELRALVESGLAQPQLGDVVEDDDGIHVQRDWYYAGRVVHTETIEPQGAVARQVLVSMILDGRLLAPSGERLRDDLAAWGLYVALGNADGDVPEAADWLQERLATLGVETLADSELLEPEDLAFEGIPSWERERFDTKYPRFVSLGDLKLAIHYKVPLRQVVAEYVSGSRKTAPQRWELPAWSGWKVKYRKASRIVDVR
ncbi:helicase-related protein [Marinobacteraceae bacterium S3BR75-40.1]